MRTPHSPSDLFAGRWPGGRLTFYNLHTDERLTVTYRDEEGRYDYEALDDVNYLLRCHHTNEMAAMDVRVIEFVNLVQKQVGSDREIRVVSGYRSPEYQALLIRMGRRVARHSLHVQGQAIDFFIPGVNLRTVRETALKLKCGGVGYYPRKRFVHLDSGPFRWW
ncbi:MAG: DUF882 domain-containing protein [Nitrospirota bacterium]